MLEAHRLVKLGELPENHRRLTSDPSYSLQMCSVSSYSSANRKKIIALWIVGVLTTLYVIAELSLAMLTGSLVLLSDGFHNLSDVISIGIAYWAIVVRDPFHLFFSVLVPAPNVLLRIFLAMAVMFMGMVVMFMVVDINRSVFFVSMSMGMGASGPKDDGSKQIYENASTSHRNEGNRSI